MTTPNRKLTSILGVSAYYHDSAACLIQNGKIVAAAQEERFTRKKHDAGFPSHAVEYCLRQGGVGMRDVDYLVFYDKPFVKFERLLETYLSYAPKGLGSFLTAIPVWIKEKLFLRNLLEKAFRQVGSLEKKENLPPLLFGEHHESHAAGAFFPSPYEEAVVLCMDGVGEWATTSAWIGRGNQLTPLWEIPFPHSIGLLYSAFTYYTGFKVNSGEYKVMGLAPYGEPKYVKTILDNVVDVKPDGTFRLNMDYFDYCTGLRMTNNKFDAIFGGPPRQAESTLTQREMDLARSVQEVTEMVMLRLANSLYRETGLSHLCLSGGVALNCVGNGRVLREGPFSGLWIQPAAGDAGSALGAALNVHYSYLNQPRVCQGPSDSMRGSYLGPRFSNEDIESRLQQLEARYERVEDSDLYRRVAEYLAEGKVIGWLQGHMEFGPRALGGRSILGDPRSEKMQSVMNLKIKYRESFRPFAPSVLRERVSEYFEMDTDSPYMLLVAPVVEKRRRAVQPDQQKLWGIDLLNVPKSDIPAVTHVDYSARVQTVSPDTNPRYYQLLQEFEKQTGCAVLINTSFNVRGEPIVCTPEDAYRCFMRTEMDVLVLENCLVLKEHQKPVQKDETWMKEFELD
ncbi:carbamoyltransferase family protein [Candidatus Nitrospira allomarina]|uniref:Carbamoyltransferase n=1 Tax=Candidatus Nitrospira allomarina TaxID=3020900 RepID=A0AA96GCD3_9BACT|nr:carbamoyltransferase [Candidatus Nitrospira allomarina]WNM58986.1 carbamoyltransferase [Candidatus Nitrospira allomarina]